MVFNTPPSFVSLWEKGALGRGGTRGQPPPGRGCARRMRGRGAAAPAEPRWEREVSGALRSGGSELLASRPGAGRGEGSTARLSGARRCGRSAGMLCEKQILPLQRPMEREERGAAGEPRTGVPGNIPSFGVFSHFCLKNVSRCLWPEARALEHL